VNVELILNGRAATLDVRTDEMLLPALRRHGLLSVRETCAIGVCGACTVLLDGEPVRSCLLFTVQAEGCHIETIESLGSDPATLHPVQQAFWEKHGLQCGFCTPGMVLTAKALLEHNPAPTDEEIRLALEGNICRCTGYVFIVDAVRHAAELLREGAGG